MVVLGSFLLIGFLFFGMMSGVLLGSLGMDVHIRPAWLVYVPIVLSVVFVVGGSVMVRRTRGVNEENQR
jgi:uncharacterized membrane protein YhaH (DUF805 family)